MYLLLSEPHIDYISLPDPDLKSQAYHAKLPPYQYHYVRSEVTTLAYSILVPEQLIWPGENQMSTNPSKWPLNSCGLQRASFFALAVGMTTTVELSFAN